MRSPTSDPVLAEPKVKAPPAMPYLPQLDGVRAIAVLIVFVSHAGLGHIVPGGFGVTVFFFLSGYLISTLLRIESATTGSISLSGFYVRRALRILPPMYLTLLFAGLLYGFDPLRSPISVAGVLGQITFLTNYPGLLGTDLPLPIPLWSLAVEEHFYLVFPLTYSLWLRLKPPRQAALICLSLCGLVLGIRIFSVWWLQDHSQIYYWTHTRIDAILFGCCLGLWNNPVIESDRAWRPKLRHLAISIVVILGTFAVREETFRETLRYTLQSMALFVLFAALLQKRNLLVRLLVSAPMRRIGLYSYTFYLAHLPILIALEHGAPWLGQINLIAVAFCLTLAYSALIFSAVERPCARLRQRLLKGHSCSSEQRMGQSLLRLAE